MLKMSLNLDLLALFKDFSISRILRPIQAVSAVIDLKSFSISCRHTLRDSEEKLVFSR